MPSLEGKSAVVTGASSGIGAATAQALAAEGARVVGGARRTDRIAAPVTALEVDVTDPASCDAFVKAAAEETVAELEDALEGVERDRHPRQRCRPRAWA